MKDKNSQQNIDQIMEEFFSQSVPPSEEFTQNVLSSLPDHPQVLWISHLGHLAGGLAGLCFLYFVQPLGISSLLLLLKQLWWFCAKLPVYAPVAISQISLMTIAALVFTGLWLFLDEESI